MGAEESPQLLEGLLKPSCDASGNEECVRHDRRACYTHRLITHSMGQVQGNLVRRLLVQDIQLPRLDKHSACFDMWRDGPIG